MGSAAEQMRPRGGDAVIAAQISSRNWPGSCQVAPEFGRLATLLLGPVTRNPC